MISMMRDLLKSLFLLKGVADNADAVSDSKH
jgi:hypothetical protein